MNLLWSRLQPRSALLFDVCPWPESSSGTLHTRTDLRHPMPKRSRCKGHTVISCMFSGVLKQELLAKISSTSVSHPLNLSNFLWLEILFLHDTSETTWHDEIDALGSGPHSPPTKPEKVHAILTFRDREWYLGCSENMFTLLLRSSENTLAAAWSKHERKLTAQKSCQFQFT